MEQYNSIVRKRKYYKHLPHPKQRISVQFGGALLMAIGVGIMLYYAMPVFLWKFVHEPARARLITPLSDKKETSESTSVLNASTEGIIPPVSADENWFLGYSFSHVPTKPTVASYSVSIPKIDIHNATVSTIDTDLGKHLVQYWGTPVPPRKGNTVIFGHSTLPQLFNPNDYKTIFAKIHDLAEGDTIGVKVNNLEYTYKIFSIFITTPSDLSVLNQDDSGNFITIITCTPPGTTWKRLIIRAKLQTS